MVDKLKFGFTHSAVEVERLGLTTVVGAAMEEADRRLVRAASGLVELGVGIDDLRRLLRIKYTSSGRT
jgi:hypothetical protein